MWLNGCGSSIWFYATNGNGDVCTAWDYLSGGAAELLTACLDGACEGIGPAIAGSSRLLTRLGSTCGCFEASTEVATPDGARPIEEIEVGDLVLAWNEETGKVAAKPVAALIRPEPRELYNLALADETGVQEIFSVTSDHPWMVEVRGWTETIALRPGDRIKTATNEPLIVASLAFTGEIAQTYNLEVEGWHTFMVGDGQAVVHNDGRCAWALGGHKTFLQWMNRLRAGSWSSDAITNTIQNGQKFTAPNFINPANGATRFMDPSGTGRYIVRDNVTGEILRLSRPGFEPPPGTLIP